MSAGVELDQVTVRFGQFTAVQSATLDIKGGEFLHTILAIYIHAYYDIYIP